MPIKTTLSKTIPLIIAGLVSVVSAKEDCLLLQNVTGYTSVSSSEQLQSVQWLAIKDGKIAGVGAETTPKTFDLCQKIDGKGRTLLPGLIDAHGHVSGLGNERLRVVLRGIKSEALAVEAVKKFANENPKSQWILGRGWNQVLWLNKQFPTKASLDLSGIKRPIFLRRIDGHAAWGNSLALKLAGIDRNTPDPQGGKIVRDANGEATGLLIDTAMSIVENKIPAPSVIEQDYAFDKAFEHLLSLGITSVHDAGVSALDLSIYEQRVKNKKMPLRIYGMLSGADAKLYDWLKRGPFESADDFLSIKSVKLYADGALGSRGAAMLAPYSDDVDNKGLLLTKPKTLDRLVKDVMASGFQVNAHAIGDRGNRLVLDAIEKAYKKTDGRKLRNRIEHSQVVSLDDIPRFKSLDMIASIQPIFATSDMNMAEDRVGSERIKGAYAWKKFLEQGTVIASGSDFPVELANPLFGLHAAVTRQDHNNQPPGGWLPSEKLTIDQAIKSFTLNAAYAAHQENQLGSLEVGKWADFILLDNDIVKGNPQNIWKAKVLETWIAGEVRYKKD